MDGASAITGIIGFSIDVGLKLSHYISGVKHAPESAFALEKEVRSLSHVLEQMKGLLEKEGPRQATVFEASSVLFVTLRGCRDELESLLQQLEGMHRDTFCCGFLYWLKWPLDEDDTTKEVNRLHQYVHTFQMSLSVSEL